MAVGVSLAVKANLASRILRANVKVVSGLADPQDLLKNPGGVTLYVRTGPAHVFAVGRATKLTVIGAWVSVYLDLDYPGFIDMTSAAATYDPSDVREIGIQLDTSATTTTPTPAVVAMGAKSRNFCRRCSPPGYFGRRPASWRDEPFTPLSGSRYEARRARGKRRLARHRSARPLPPR